MWWHVSWVCSSPFSPSAWGLLIQIWRLSQTPVNKYQYLVSVYHQLTILVVPLEEIVMLWHQERAPAALTLFQCAPELEVQGRKFPTRRLFLFWTYSFVPRFRDTSLSNLERLGFFSHKSLRCPVWVKFFYRQYWMDKYSYTEWHSELALSSTLISSFSKELKI